MIKTTTYYAWAHMIQRCSNPKNPSFKTHGARGIKVCQRWLKFEDFYEDMKDKPKSLQLDRRDNDKGYFKENCRWTTPRINSQNTRQSKYWFINGIRYNSATHASEELGISSTSVEHYCDGYQDKRGWHPPKKNCHSSRKYS